MKLVIFNEENTVLEIIENIAQPVAGEKTVKWEGGQMDTELPFILVGDDVPVGETVTEDMKAQDQKAAHPLRDLLKENEELRQELALTNADLMGLMEYVFGGGQ
jgi:hypothetical protein